MLDFGNYRKSLIIAGSGRSGTTWMMELLNFKNQYRVMFEPFHNDKVPIFKNWRYRQYLPQHNKEMKFIQTADNILRGKIRNDWVDHFNTKTIVTKRIIKDIRMNLILKWMFSRFPGIKIILMLRHPCAVAYSKLKLNWDSHLEEYLNQTELMRDFLSPFESHLIGETDEFNKHIFMWCIENFIPLKQFNNEEIHIIFYEDMCINLSFELKKVYRFLGEDIYQTEKIKSVPSALVREDSAINTNADLLSNWQNFLSAEKVDNAINIVNLFGLDLLYDHNPIPLISSDKVLSLFE